MSDLRDRCRGVLLGLAAGDALGTPAEFLSAEQVFERYGVTTELIGGGCHEVDQGETIGLAGERHARRLEDLVGAPEAADLVAQSGQLLALGAGEVLRPRAVAGLVLAHPDAQGLVMDAEVTRDGGDATLGLSSDPASALTALGGYFDGLAMDYRLSSLRIRSTKKRSLRQSWGVPTGGRSFTDIRAAPSSRLRVGRSGVRAAPAAGGLT